MQKKKIANLIMVLIIAALAAGGGFWAFSQRDAAPAALGTEYHIQKLNDNALTEPEQELTCTITIRCDTVLQSLDSLREEKLPYVPRDGVMLPDEIKSARAPNVSWACAPFVNFVIARQIRIDLPRGILYN